MIKIFDNSAITSMGKEIVSVDLLRLMKSRYDVRVTGAVIAECSNSKDERLIRSIEGLSIASKKDEKYIQAMDAVKRISHRLGSGEIESIAASIMLTRLGIDNYVVIDEKYARDVVSKIHKNQEFLKEIGLSILRSNVQAP